jgi:hypothetical protein
MVQQSAFTLLNVTVEWSVGRVYAERIYQQLIESGDDDS